MKVIPVFFLCSAVLCGCHLLVPADKPPESTLLTSDDFAWDSFDIARDYEYIGVSRIDCSKTQSVFSSSGKCLPAKRPFGSIVECELPSPAQRFEFGCLAKEDVPAVYARFVYSSAAANVDFGRIFGKCEVHGAGPAAGDPERFPGDIGYKVCLFKSVPAVSEIRGEDIERSRPVGVFIDLSDNETSIDLLKQRAASRNFDGPFSFVLDARLLTSEERETAFKYLTTFFSQYRGASANDHEH